MIVAKFLAQAGMAITAITLHSLGRTGLIFFSGEEAQTFLHGQLTCDVAALTDRQVTYGSYCTPKGRVLANFLLWRFGEGFFMQLPAALREATQKRLSMYILRSKVKATDATDSFTRIGLAGAQATTVVREFFGDGPVADREVRHADGTMLIKLPVDRIEIIAPSERAAAIRNELKRHAQEEDEARWEWLDIRAGIPWVIPATQDEFVPQAINLDLIGGVSFSKGCYPGQEIVARMHYRSQVKRRMYLANIATEDIPQPGDRLFSPHMSEEPCGMIVNAARSPEGGCDVLASMQITSFERDDVHWKTPDGPALRFLPLPYEVR